MIIQHCHTLYIIGLLLPGISLVIQSNLLELFIRMILGADIRDGVFEANQDTACDTNDEDQTQDDE